MAAGDLAQTLALAAFAVDCPTVDREGLPTDVTALELGSPHAGSHALDDQVAFEFGDRTDDHDDGPAERAGRVDAFAEADELDVQPVELVQDLEEMPGGSRDAIAGPDQDHIELTAAGIPHHVAEPWPERLHAADPVRVLLDDLIAALSGHLTQVVNLRLRVLIDGTDPHI